MALIFSWSFSWAKGPGKSYSTEQVIIDSTSPGKFALGFKDYEDIRIDSDLDGKVDFWYLRSKSIETGLRYKNGELTQISIKKVTSNETIKEAIFVKKNSKFILASMRTRPVLTLNGTIDDHCVTAKNTLNTEVQKLPTSIKNALLQKNISSYIDDTCFDSIDPKITDALFASLQSIFSDSLLSSEDTFHNCLSSPNAQSIFKNQNSEPKLALEVLSAKMSLDLRKIASTPSESSPLFSCKVDSSLKSIKATYVENAGITVMFPKEGLANLSNTELSKLLRHELLHRTGLLDESTTEQLLNICPKSSADASFKKIAMSNKSFGGNLTSENVMGVVEAVSSSQSADTKDATPVGKNSTTTKSSRSPASATGGGNEGMDIRNEIANAEAIIPSAEKLAQTKVDKSPEGIQAAVKESVAESTPVLRMANQVMGAANTPAVASSTYVAEVPKADTSAAPSYESASSSGGSNSSDSGSGRRYQSKNGRYQSSSETVVSSDGPKVVTTSRTGLAAGERVVEEVDLTTGTNFKAANTAPARGQGGTPREAPANRTTAASKVPTATVPAAPSSLGGEVASPGAINLGSNGSSSTSLGGDIQGETNSPSSAAAPPANNRRVSGNRAPASTGNTQSNTTSSREEIVSFLSSGSYNVTRNKLRDTNFVNTLKSNKVTIIDLYGNSFGAPKGEVIFLDEGNKFVRQK